MENLHRPLAHPGPVCPVCNSDHPFVQSMCRFAAIGYHYMYDMRGCTFRKFEDSLIHSKAVTRAAQPHVKPSRERCIVDSAVADANAWNEMEHKFSRWMILLHICLVVRMPFFSRDMALGG